MELRAHLTDRTLAHVSRWGTTPIVHEKSVAEHSFYVARIARRICEVLKNKRGFERLDTSKVVDMALMHDEEEAYSGDIVHTFKTATSELHQRIREEALNLFREAYNSIPNINAAHFIQLREEFSDRESIEAQIVDVADEIAGLAECEEEISLGNRNFEDLLGNYHQGIDDITYPWFKKIKGDLGF